MKSYRDMFPEAAPPPITLEVEKKLGAIPKGSYRFLEHYCTEPGCDCRRVTLFVTNDKGRPVAVISFGFDHDDPLAGPFLDAACYQSPYAPQLLEFFAVLLNSSPDWLQTMHRQYRQVRVAVDGKRYRGRPFPTPGSSTCQAMAAPELEAVLERSLSHGKAGCRAFHPKAKQGRPPLLQDDDERSAGVGGKEPGGEGMARFASLYARAGNGALSGIVLALQDELRRYVATVPAAGEELASLFAGLFRRYAAGEGKENPALRLLADTLDFYQVAVEGNQPAARQQMQRFQTALAKCLFPPGADPDLAAAAADLLFGSRARLVPELLRVIDNARVSPDFPSSPSPGLFVVGAPGDDLCTALAKSLHEMGITSAFEGVREVMELLHGNEHDLRVPLAGALLTAEDPFLREIAALLVFEPDAGLALEVSRLLAAVEGGSISPVTLRRMIVTRNWFHGEIKDNIDLAIAGARRARVSCAHFATPPDADVYAAIRRYGHRFHVVVPDGAAFRVWTLELSHGKGVAGCAEVRVASVRELERLLVKYRKEGAMVSSVEDLDLSVCRALADGRAHRCRPLLGLAELAELLGCDRWRPLW